MSSRLFNEVREKRGLAYAISSASKHLQDTGLFLVRAGVDNKKIVIIIGPPGSGKGTQAFLLADKLGLYYLETSKIIELKISEAKKGEYQKLDGKKYYLLDEKNNWEQGKLCSPPLVTFWITEKVRELSKEHKGIVFAGSPRSLYETEKMMPLLERLYGKRNIKIKQKVGRCR